MFNERSKYSLFLSLALSMSCRISSFVKTSIAWSGTCAERLRLVRLRGGL